MKKVKKSHQLPYEILIIIFSYITDNKSCVDFSLVNKYHREVFDFMMERSSTLLYRLRFLDGEKPKDYTFNIFSLRREPNFRIDDRFYVTSIEEYEKGIKGIDIVQVCAKINKKYGEVAMISGGYALLHFLKDKNYDFNHNRIFDEYFENYLDYYDEECRPICDDPQCRNECEHYHESIPAKFKYEFNKSNDIDIFLLGDNKRNTAFEIIKEFEKYDISIDILSLNGCYNVFTVKPSERKGVKERKYLVKNLYFQLILKRYANTPNDIFSFFDLDICKIGYFPGLKKVVAPVDFFRAMSNGKNYSDFVFKCLSTKHKARIYKYFYRTGIRTTIQCPPLMSYYHDHTRQNFCNKVIRWGKQIDSTSGDDNSYKYFGQLKLNIPHKGINYYSYNTTFRCVDFEKYKPSFFKETEHKYYYQCFGIRKEKYRFVYVKDTQNLMLKNKTLIGYV